MWLYTRGYLFGGLGPSRREETIWSVVNLRRAMSFTCSRGWTCHIPMGRTRQFHSSMVSKRFKDVFHFNSRWSSRNLSYQPHQEFVHVFFRCCAKLRDVWKEVPLRRLWEMPVAKAGIRRSRCVPNAWGSWQKTKNNKFISNWKRKANICTLEITWNWRVYINKLQIENWWLICGLSSSWKHERFARRVCAISAEWEFCPRNSEQEDLQEVFVVCCMK